MENQLKATELRLNNQVFFSDESEGVKNAIATIKGIEDDDMLKFTAINVTDNSTKTRISISQNTIEGWGELSQFSGIPLTENILLRLGFEKGFHRYGLENCGLKCHKSLKENYWIVSQGFGMQFTELTEIQYIHQFQNLFFSLCGEELTFKKW